MTYTGGVDHIHWRGGSHTLEGWMTYTGGVDDIQTHVMHFTASHKSYDSESVVFAELFVSSIFRFFPTEYTQKMRQILVNVAIPQIFTGNINTARAVVVTETLFCHFCLSSNPDKFQILQIIKCKEQNIH